MHFQGCCWQMGIPELLGPIINLVITTPINFVINKLWAFKTKKNETTETD